MACKGGSCSINRKKSRAATSATPSAPSVTPQITAATQPQPFGNLAGVGVNPGMQPQLPMQQPLSGQIMNAPGAQPGQKPRTAQGKVWLGEEAQTLRFPHYESWQQPAFQLVLQKALEGLMGNQGQPQNQFDFAPIEQQAREGFQQKTIPSIAERFTSLGGQKSSAFPQQLGQAGRGLETDLAAMKSAYGLDQAKLGLTQQDMQQRLLLSLLGVGLSPQYESAYSPRKSGLLENLGVGAASGIGSALPSAITGGLSSIGSGISNLFNSYRNPPNVFGT